MLGIGFGVASTANLAILAKLYPSELARAVSLIETVSGIGMAVGPLIGAYTYSWFGFKGPYIFLLLGFLLFESLIRKLIPNKVDEDESNNLLEV